MNKSVVSVAILLLQMWIGHSALAQAPAQTFFVDVGYCDMHAVQQRMVLRDVTTTTPYMPPRKALYLLPPAPGPFAPPPPPIDVAPDPSGVNFLAIRSAINGVQFWVRWTGEVIAISPNGAIQLAGNCAIDQAFAQRFYRPTLPPMQPQMPLAMGFGVVAIGPSAPPAPHAIPQELFSDQIYNVPPMMVTRELARSCLQTARSEPNAYFTCVIRQAMSHDQILAYECSQRARDAQDMTLCMLSSKLGDNERATIDRLRACYARHGSRWDEYSLCMAEDRVDPRLMHVVRCAQENMRQGQQPNYWSMGVCAFGPGILKSLNPNPEAAIAIDCAARSGGNPKVFVACAGGQLAARELEKCLNDGFGDDGCFGKNNTLSRVYDEIGEGIAQAFGGKNTAIYLAWQAATVSSNPRQAIEVMNNIAREAQRVQYNFTIEAEKGLHRMGEAASQVIPQITIGKPRGKIFGKRWSL
jgi:hypothetical protein